MNTKRGQHGKEGKKRGQSLKDVEKKSFKKKSKTGKRLASEKILSKMHASKTVGVP